LNINLLAEENTGFEVPPALFIVLVVIIFLVFFSLFVYLMVLLIKALRKYIRSSGVRTEKAIVCKTLGEKLKQCRMENNMTQEFVADALGVSRQAVSKWEMGTSDPSTSNLLALAKLYGVSADELLKNITDEKNSNASETE